MVSGMTGRIPRMMLCAAVAFWGSNCASKKPWIGGNRNADPVVMTVTGPIPPAQMGFTLEHEHVLVDFIGADSTGYHRWDRTGVVKKVLPYLLEIKQQGVQTLIECTPAYLGRDPVLLKILSEKSGLYLLTNTGYYGARDNLYVPKHAFGETAEQLANRWTAEWEHGIERTGIRPGFIKISVDRNDTLSPMHQKIIRAAAKTHLRTGLTIASHTGPELPALAQISLLKEEGVDPSAFVWVHALRGSMASRLKAAKLGAWISCDNVKADSANIRQVLEMLSTMKEAGLLNRVLISHDAGWYRVGEPGGGTFNGFTPVPTALIPAMKQRGFTDSDVRQVFKTNPREAFTINIRRTK